MQNLGYEKYAGIFEEAKIGMLELPYLSEERLEKLGIPLGPRIRILQVRLHEFIHNQRIRFLATLVALHFTPVSGRSVVVSDSEA